MDKNCTILWIDDEYSDPQMLPFIIEAEGEDIILEGYKSFEEGFEILEKDLNRFDAILLDGMFFEKRDQVKGTEDETGLGMAIAKINELKVKKVFPWFVLSGKVEFTKNNNSIIKANKALCFDKTNPRDVVNLFSTIKEEVGNQNDVKIKYKYHRVLQVCSDKYIGEKHFDRVLKLIKDVENDVSDENPEDLLTPIRKIIEAIFSLLGNIGVIPDEIIKNKGSLNGTCNFLYGKHNDYLLSPELLDPLVSFNIDRLLRIVQDGSHSEGELKLRVNDYIKASGLDYMYKSCVFITLDLLIWVKDFVDKNPDRTKNLSLWSKRKSNTEWIGGKVIRIAENGYGTFEPDDNSKTISITPEQVGRFELKKDDIIKVKANPSADGKKLHIKELERI